MSYLESRVLDHLERVQDPEEGYEFGSVSDKRIKALHIINTAITQINSAAQLALESGDESDTIYGEGSFAEKERWLQLKTILETLAREQHIDLEKYQVFFNTIINYFIQDK
jgi:hypothetical protein